MKYTAKEKTKIHRRRKLWALFDWCWAYKRNDGGKYKTEWTSNEEESKGFGFFRNNHSLNCGCRMCEWRTFEKKMKRRTERYNAKKQINNIKKVMNTVPIEDVDDYID